MKKLFAFLCSLTLLCASVFVLPAKAETYGKLSYQKYADYIKITSCSEKETLTEITIPETIDGLPVTIIGSHAFSNCSVLTSVTIPTSVTTIWDGAFNSCSNLESITIPDSVITISTSAFSSCTSLTSVTIPESVTTIGEWAFEWCSALESVTIKNPDCKIYDDSYTFYKGSNEYPTIYGYENSTAQTYAEKYNYPFQTLGTNPQPTEPPTENTAGDTTWNGKNPDLNNDGKIDAKDAALVLVFAAEFGAGNVKSFQDFMNQQYPEG